MTVQTSPAPVTVLVVEDNVLVRYCAVDALGEGGFHVLEAATAPGAMALLEREHVDVLFTDVNMPGEFDGLELARRVRRRWPRVAVVITSGRSCPDQIVEGVRFVPKPYMADRLARLIGETVDGRGGQVAASSLSLQAG
jgi:CheY-like chemotaxis protein